MERVPQNSGSGSGFFGRKQKTHFRLEVGSGVTSDYRSEGSTSWLADAATVFRGDGDDRTKCRMISGDHRGDHGTAPHRGDEAGRRHDLKIGGHGRNGLVTTPEITDHGAKNASGPGSNFSNRTRRIAPKVN